MPHRENSNWESAFPATIGGGGVALILLFILNPFQPAPIRRFVTAEPSEIDFGEISIFDRGQATVQLKNAGNEPVEFQVHLECACTYADPSSGTIESGATVPVQLSYKPKGYSDSGSRLNESTTLQINLRKKSESDSVFLNARAKVLKPFSVNPKELQIYLHSFGETPFQVQLSLSDDIKEIAIASQPEAVGRLSLGEIDPTFRVVKLDGCVNQTHPQSISLAFDVTFSDSEKRTIKVPLVLLQQEAFQCSDLFVELSKGEARTLHFRPTNGTEHVNVTNVSCNSKDLKFSFNGSDLEVSASESFENQSCHFRVTLNCEATGYEDRIWTRDILVHSNTEFDLQSK